jgi:phosphinothricin acetyltransferase
MAISVRALESTDSAKVLAIYHEAIKGAHASFDVNVPTWTQWNQVHLAAHRFVAQEDNKKVLGWSALSKVSDRREFAGVVECYTYVRADSQRKGVGTTLLQALIEATEKHELWTLQANIFPENAGALALHQKVGFEIVGTRRQIGRHRGRWRDVLLLERRSPVVI